MSNYAVFAGSNTNLKGGGWKDLDCLLETLEEAIIVVNDIFKNNTEFKKYTWTQIVCLKTFKIIHNQELIDVDNYVCEYNEYEFN